MVIIFCLISYRKITSPGGGETSADLPEFKKNFFRNWYKYHIGFMCLKNIILQGGKAKKDLINEYNVWRYALSGNAFVWRRALTGKHKTISNRRDLKVLTNILYQSFKDFFLKHRNVSDLFWC